MGPQGGGANGPPPILDLKVILATEEVSYLFGFDGVLLAQLKQQTGANIGITDGDPNLTQEYVLCIGGTIDIIFKVPIIKSTDQLYSLNGCCFSP